MSISNYLAKLVELKNQLVANLQSMGVAADESEKLNTLVPKVLECGTEQNVEWVDSPSGTIDSLNSIVKKVDIPYGISSMDNNVFSGCSSLESITIPDSVTSIGYNAFYECSSLASITIPDSVTSIGGDAFVTCTALKNVILSNNITSLVTINSGFFFGCTSLESVTIGSKTTSIEQNTFYNCTSLKKIIIPDSVTSMGKSVFSSCSNLQDIIIGSGLTIIEESTFKYCSALKNIIIPNNITQINERAFQDCSSLESIIIPDSVTYLGPYLFQNCKKLAHIYYTGTQTQWNSISKGEYWNSRMGSSVSGGTKIHYNYIDTPYNVYGVIWDGSSSTKLTRTNDSEKFSNPVPALGGTGGSSPFDSCYPWSEIERVTIDGNELVKIPKFWYKITKDGNSLSFQIADGPVKGFNVSPAHADRGDGKGERDYVYIGRYKCTDNEYKSVTNTAVMTNITRATARSGITSLGSGYYMQDFALWWTVRMLYLVEFADWNSQAVIGYGCGNGRSTVNTGTTDSMSYHTGTMQSTRTTYGTGVQYRWIEDPWGNVIEWCDGIRFSGSDVYVFNNPSQYSDSSGGTKTGTRPTSGGYISQWSVPSVSGYDWALYPSAARGSDSTYISDYCYYYNSGVVLSVGGAYGQYKHNGAFYLNGFESASGSVADVGVRLQYLP